MASNPEAEASGWTSVLPEPAELPSRIRNKLEASTPAPPSSPQSDVDRQADTVPPPTARPKVVSDPKPASSGEGEVPVVPPAPRVPAI
jgi:hypothetical protein